MNNLLFILHSCTITAITIISIKFGRSFAISTIATYGILANMFVLKQICLFNLEVTTADVFVVGISLGLNLLQEKYGRDTAQNTVLVSFWCLAIYTILTQFQIWYAPSSLDSMHHHFSALFALAPRLMIASLASYLVSQTIDVYFYGYLKSRFTSNNYSAYFIRNYASIAISQLVDTILFSILGLAGLGYNLIDIISFSYAVKLVAVWFAVTLTAAVRKVTTL